MARNDTSFDDLDGLLATHESRREMERVLGGCTLRASDEREARGGMNAIGLIITILIGLIVFNLPPLAAWILNSAPGWIDALLPLVQRIAAK